MISINVVIKWCLVLLFCVYQLSDTVSCFKDKIRGLRRNKRGILCASEVETEIQKNLLDGFKKLREVDTVSFENETVLTSWLWLHDGMVSGISSLTNITEIRTLCEEENKMIIFNTTLRMTNVTVSTQWTRIGLGIFYTRQTGSLTMIIKSMDVKLALHLSKTQIMDFKVENNLIWKPENVHFIFDSGLSLLDKLVTYYINSFFNFFKLNIDWAIKTIIKIHLENELEYHLYAYSQSYLSDIVSLSMVNCKC